MDRRTFLAASAAGLLGGRGAFADRTGAVDMPIAWWPRYVPTTGVAPWEIHVLPGRFALLWTLPGDRALRYQVGIGRAGLYEPGRFVVGAKKVWPAWTPTEDMIAREPELYAPHEDGMPGGPGNPLGARALYLFTDRGADTFLRIHGTNDPSGLGRRVSNGCVRLMNIHVTDLYERVPIGTAVTLHPV
jgi:lipoprotein-anchoring transpeptidase ErfK/SrfK